MRDDEFIFDTKKKRTGKLLSPMESRRRFTKYLLHLSITISIINLFYWLSYFISYGWGI